MKGNAKSEVKNAKCWVQIEKLCINGLCINT